MKKIIFIAFMFSLTFGFSQVQVQTNPNATINDENPFIDASKYNSFGSNIGKGLYFPQTDLTTWEFKTSAINPGNFSTYFDGMIVYNKATGNTLADATKGGQQVAVTPGFYYFSNPGQTFPAGNINSGKWVRIGNDSQTAAANAWVLGGNTGTTAVTADATTGNITAGSFMGTKDNKKVVLASNNVRYLEIGAEGGVKLDPASSTTFDIVLDVHGKARFRKGIITSKSTYPDYVFDNYFTGKSEVNPSYQFMNLDEVEQFIKENNHLPGVTKIDDLSKDGDAYMVDVSETSIQTLEKVEELYLHVIEQQKQIKALKAEIAELKKK